MKRIALLLVAVGLAGIAGSEAGSPTREDVAAALDRALSGMAELQKNGGWGMACSPGHEVVWGQDKQVGADWITLQPPATPTVAGVYLRAYRVTRDERWRAVAGKARDGILALQNEQGGFPHEGKPERPPRGSGTFDDGVTTGSTGFLIDWWQVTGQASDRERVDKAGGFILAAQYADSGGWPQAHPPRPDGYQKDITFNDGVTRNIIFVLLKLHEATGDARYLDAAKRGGDCIIRLQGPGDEGIWAQQYKYDTLEPSWARYFEPPGYTPNESTGICDALIALYFATREDKYLAPLPRAFLWYDTHRLANGLYARLYEPGTQRPVYGRRDKPEKVYELENATGGYGWQGDWYPESAKHWHECIQQEGVDTCAAQYAERAKRIHHPSDASVREVIDALDAKGWWSSAPSESERAEHERLGVDGSLPLIRSRDFVDRAGRLLDWLEGE